MKRMMMVVGMVATVGGAACDDDGGSKSDATQATTATTADTSDTSQGEAIELVGVWASEFGDETITQTNWNGYCEQEITSFDNDDNVAVLETVGGEGCTNGFGRVIWTDVADDSFAYCTTAFGKATAAEAEAAPETNIDRTNLDTGCGGFPWSELSLKP